MTTVVKVEGLRELDRALGELTKSAARATLHRVLKKAGAPIAAEASRLAPRKSGELSRSVKVSTRIKNTTGNAEYSAVLRSGGSKEQAVAAMRSARRAGGKSFGQVYVGPERAKTRRAAIKRIVQEFGSVKQAPRPYMRPAWEAKKAEALSIIKRDLGAEIIATAKRARVRALRKAAKSK